ncbi:hypothetical protein H0H92_007361 [Tricholoma furcatifolium]|nr:hypothetical protein H0H92_007361 [Tricholoma furcatifolium]
MKLNLFKDTLLNECTSLTTNQEVVYYNFWGAVSAGNLTPTEAANFLAFFFTVLAFAYYRQLLDPTSVANSSRAPSNQARLNGGFPTHYNPPYDASVPNLPYTYSAHPTYGPPAGPPPGHEEHDETFVPPYDGKPPGYTGGDTKGYDVDGKDPFSDFEERDVTSRPYPGGSESFHR